MPPCDDAPSNRTSHGGTMRTTTAATLTAVLLLGLTACTSSGDDSKPETKPTPAASSEPKPAEPAPAPEATALEDAVRDYTAAYFKGEASTAHRMLSERCRKDINELLFGAAVKEAAEEYGPDHAATDVKAEVSGEMGRVSYRVEGLPKFDQQAQPWTLEGGAWKYDAC